MGGKTDGFNAIKLLKFYSGLESFEIANRENKYMRGETCGFNLLKLLKDA